MRAALTSAGITSPPLLPQLVRVCVMTEARSLSDSDANEAIAVPGLPFSSRSICAPLAPLATLLPASGGKAGGVPLPSGPWQA